MVEFPAEPMPRNTSSTVPLLAQFNGIFPVFFIYLLLTILVFHPTLSSEFAYDTGHFLPKFADPSISPSALVDVQSYSTATGVMSWRPLPLLSMMILDAQLFNLSPLFSHLLNLFIQATNGFLIFLILFSLGLNFLPIFLAGLFFLIHPLTSEVVLCTGFRFDSLCLFFMLLCIHSSLSDIKNYRAFYPLLFTLALLSKETAAILVALIPLIIWLKTDSTRRTFQYFTIYFTIFFAFIFCWINFKYTDYPTEFMGGGGRFIGMANFITAFSEVFLPRFILPINLRIDHEFQPEVTAASWRIIRAIFLSFFFLIVLLTPPFIFRRLNTKAATASLIGASLLLFSFLPVSQIIPVPDPVAERLCYTALAGLSIWIGAILHILLNTRFRLIPLSLSVSALITFAVLSCVRAHDWRSDLDLNYANWRNSHTMKGLESRAVLGLLISEREYKRGELGSARLYLNTAEQTINELLSKQPDHPVATRLQPAIIQYKQTLFQ